MLRHFAQRRGLQYPLLADEGSAVIRAFGILNETVPRGGLSDGVPYPGTYVLDERGIVQSKHFEDDYRERLTGGSILLRQMSGGGTETFEIETRHLKLQGSSSNATVYPGIRVTLAIDVELPEKMHVYAPTVTGGYIPIDWKMKEGKGWKNFPAEYPASRMLY